MRSLSKLVGLYVQVQVSCHFSCKTFHRLVWKCNIIMVARGPPNAVCCNPLHRVMPTAQTHEFVRLERQGRLLLRGEIF